jgi:acetyltransferase-like isoleucine patch superfamily enzyme
MAETGGLGTRLAYIVSKGLKKARQAAITGSQIDPTSKVEPGTSFVESAMKRHSFCGYDCDIAYARIGSFTSIANGVVIGGGRHPLEWVGMSPVFYEGRDSVKAKFSVHRRPPPEPVFIGNDVWIGRNAIILPGVEVGHGAVVGAGAIVTKSVPPYGVVVGCPAKLVKFRFDIETINRLLEIAWWDFSDDELRKWAGSFTEPETFLRDYVRAASDDA